MLMRCAVGAAGLIFFTTLGILGVFFAPQMQAYYLRGYERGYAGSEFSRRYLASKAWLTHTRIGGAGSFLAAAVCLYALIRNIIDLITNNTDCD